MDILAQFIDFVLHVDVHLAAFLAQYGAWTYVLLFCIVFCETGLVVTPILPGDSLLFVTGALSGAGLMHAPTVVGLLSVAAIGGDTVNYWIGRRVGPAVFEREKTRFFKKEHLLQAHEFYERHGGKAIVLGRFLPIIRTFAPFVAGIAEMRYKHFVLYNVAGGIVWIAFFTAIGYFFGNLPLIKKNFTLAIYVIIVLSCIPPALEFWKARRRARASRGA